MYSQNVKLKKCCLPIVKNALKMDILTVLAYSFMVRKPNLKLFFTVTIGALRSLEWYIRLQEKNTPNSFGKFSKYCTTLCHQKHTCDAFLRVGYSFSELYAIEIGSKRESSSWNKVPTMARLHSTEADCLVWDTLLKSL